jgi:hypothetical protein
MRFHAAVTPPKHKLNTTAEVPERFYSNPFNMTGKNVEQARYCPGTLVAITDLVGLTTGARAHK